MNPYPGVEQVDKIASWQAPVLRNLQITQCYYELSQAMMVRTGNCANWCTFATWASKQAGQTIRKEDLERALEQLLKPTSTNDRSLEAVATETQREEEDIWQRLWEVLNPADIMDRSSDAVARGNQKVFAEIGREFARFLTNCGEDAIFNAEKIAQFCAALRPGDPPDGQRYLQDAFTRYYQVFFESDAKKRAELMLLANIEIGLHEQTRLQPEIAEALNASIGDPAQLTRKLLGVLFPYRGWLVYLVFLLMRLLGRPTRLDAAIKRLLTSARQKIRLFLTKNMMVLGLSKAGYLHLGKDIKATFPASLQHLTNLDLQALFQRITPTPDSLSDTGAIDWADLPDRLHYIAELFRCYQETPDLLEAPFTAEQTSAIEEGRIPEGTL